MARLGDIGEIQSGGTPSRAEKEFWENGSIPWIKIGDLTGKYTTASEEHITPLGLQKSPAKLFPKGTILYTIFATLGEVSILSVDATTNQAIAGISLKSNAVNIDYLYYFLLSLKEYVIKAGRGVAQSNINLSILKNIEVPVPDIITQEKIANTLDKISALIEKRELQLSKLDELIKSRFVEMFGDASQFACVQLENSVEEMFIGPFGSSLKNECFVPKTDGYCMVYEQKHAIRKTMDVETRYVDEAKYKELQRFTVVGGDIIVSCRGTIGETFVVPADAPLGIMHPSIMKIRLKESVYEKVFFNYLLREILQKHENKANGSGIKMAITASALGKEGFIVPPITLQNNFAAFVEQVNKSKLAIQKSLEKLETLKKSLMQKYFG